MSPMISYSTDSMLASYYARKYWMSQRNFNDANSKLAKYDLIRDIIATFLRLDLSINKFGEFFFTAGTDWISVQFDCSDFFEWGCTDSEEITEENWPQIKEWLEELSEDFLDYEYLLGQLICARLRKQRPMPVWFRHHSRNETLRPDLFEYFYRITPEN